MDLTGSDISYRSGLTSSDPSSNPRVVVSSLLKQSRTSSSALTGSSGTDRAHQQSIRSEHSFHKPTGKWDTFPRVCHTQGQSPVNRRCRYAFLTAQPMTLSRSRSRHWPGVDVVARTPSWCMPFFVRTAIEARFSGSHVTEILCKPSSLKPKASSRRVASVA
jgi:hypothetical protein